MADSAHPHSHNGHNWMLGLTFGLGGFIAAPYVLSALGSKVQIGKIMAALHGDGLGSGLVGSLNGAISHIPLVGDALVHSAYASFAATAGIAIGGILLANYLEKREQTLPADAIHWSKIIRYGSLITSALIALPSILTGISVSIAFFAACAGGAAFASHVIGNLSATIGSSGATTGSSLFAATLPHLFTCGAAILPIGLSSLFSGKKEAPEFKKDTVSMELVSASPPVKGKPCELAFRLVDSTTGRTVSVDDLATTHTQKLHTMLVDASLTDYHHLHPQYDPKRGVFICEFTPQSNLPYTAWHDLTLAGTAANSKLMTPLPSAMATSVKPLLAPINRAEAQGVTASIAADAPLRAGVDGMLNVRLTDSAGALLQDLEPIMGAHAHLVGFSADGMHMVHCHPLGAEPASDRALGDGNLQFHITPEVAGGTKFFLQIKRQGREITLPFAQRVLAPEKFTERVAQSHHQHSLSAAVG